MRTFAWKIGDFSENFCDWIHDPQTSNQIDAAVGNSWCTPRGTHTTG